MTTFKTSFERSVHFFVQPNHIFLNQFFFFGIRYYARIVHLARRRYGDDFEDGKIYNAKIFLALRLLPSSMPTMVNADVMIIF